MKKKYCFLLILALMGQTAFAETVYKGIDANGNTIYSDKPFPNSKEVELAPITTYTPPPQHSLDESETPFKKEAIKNYHINIVAPSNEETFTTEITTIDVKFDITPPLHPDDRVKVLLNNEPYGNLTTASSMQLDHLSRGSYEVKVLIVSKDAPNKIIATSNSVTFYQQRNFIRN